MSSGYNFNDGPSNENPYSASNFGSATLNQDIGNHVLAGPLKRLAARMLDGLAQLLFLLPALICFIIGMVQNDQNHGSGDILMFIAIGLGVVAFLALLTLQIYLLVTRSQTVGKLLLKVQIHDVLTQQPASFVKTFLLRGVVNGLICAIPWIGGIYNIVDCCFIFREDRRCIHDLMAGTHVVDIG